MPPILLFLYISLHFTSPPHRFKDVQWFKINYPNQIEPHSVNGKTPSGESCVHLSAYNSDQKSAVEVLRRFMNSGGRFNAPSRNPRGANPTPLAVNVLRGNLGAVEAMLVGNVDVNVTFRRDDDVHINAMDVAVAAARGQGKDSVHAEILRMLREKGARPSFEVDDMHGSEEKAEVVGGMVGVEPDVAVIVDSSGE